MWLYMVVWVYHGTSTTIMFDYALSLSDFDYFFLHALTLPLRKNLHALTM